MSRDDTIFIVQDIKGHWFVGQIQAIENHIVKVIGYDQILRIRVERDAMRLDRFAISDLANMTYEADAYRLAKRYLLENGAEYGINYFYSVAYIIRLFEHRGIKNISVHEWDGSPLNPASCGRKDQASTLVSQRAGRGDKFGDDHE